jgi:hypothetical protein
LFKEEPREVKMKTRKYFSFMASVTMLVAMLMPQSATIFALRARSIPFTEHPIASDFNGTTSVYATDMDGDGDTDVLGAAFSAGPITWWENDGDENFTEHTIAGNFDGAGSVYATDVDGDGDTDVLGAAYSADAVTWWEQGPPQWAIFLPIAVKVVGPPSSAPVLDDISNPDGDQTYTINWSTVDRATSYILEEDDNPGFPSPTTKYSGSNTSTSVSVGEVGTYYYRVQAANVFGSGPWSNVVPVEVTVIVGIRPQPGTWRCSTIPGTTVRFTVSADSSSVSDGYVSISCGSNSIPGPVPVENSAFHLSDLEGHISVTFDSETHGRGGYSIYLSDSCWQLGTTTCSP